ncbi:MULTISPECIES: 4Fe-4S binding protein [unclassified Bradyrhizobium]|uniref:4Fe-4S binding protein n=1 Tax=unclassified Bradyrhizobium TaxID=2631580 RepID=UPI00247A41A5|nr:MULTISPECIES: 4Fe-4S binding protein [unclassified Bradyrhizobium]WGS22455.1 4Fe-4S binding protein [Bradyrhizobium sp. ISRA463]WGS29430.1 4Fe-4S binding protein [Bradyrhizobium sp. ISRA464]
MSLDDHPTVRAVRARRSQDVPNVPVSSELIKDIARKCGADDAGIIEIERAAIAPQRDYIRKVFGRTRSLLAVACSMNREPVRSPARSVANEEFHGTYDHVNETARAIVRALGEHGIPSCNAVAAFPMEMDLPRIMMVQHKPIAVEAGLGRMGIHRSIIHPKFGSFVLLGTILLGCEVDAHDHPIDYNPCLECKLCVAACPVGAIKPDGSFDFLSCHTHNYHDFLGNFSQWVEKVADSKDARDYRARVPRTETLNVWQSLSFKPGYKAAYCISACPAGEDVIGPFLQRGRARGLDLVTHLSFTGASALDATVVIKGKDLQVVPGRHLGDAALNITADSQAWLRVQNRDLELAEAIDSKLVSYSDEKLFTAYMRCFPL